MYDFAQHGLLDAKTYGLEYVSIANNPFLSGASTTATAMNPSLLMVQTVEKKDPEEEKDKPKKEKVKPIEVYEVGALNNNEFKIRIDPDYLKEQIELIQDKLDYMGARKKKDTSGGSLYGKQELESMLIRLKNRYKIKKFQPIVDEYMHTTSEQIAFVLKENKNLKCDKVSEFIPDLPKAAMKAIKQYENMCIALCNQKANFYIIADEKDFGVKTKRRDPILLAQSPFGFFWQILGAWDKEMVFLGDL